VARRTTRKRRRAFSPVALAAIGAGLAACASEPAPAPSDFDEFEFDESEVVAAVEAYTRATEARDEAGIRAALIDDGRYAWYEGGELRYRSADDVVASLAMFPPDQVIRTTLSELRVTPLGARGAWVNAGFQTEVGNGAFAFGGHITFVLERTEAGWKIVGGRAD
jgi:hypothetical protein